MTKRPLCLFACIFCLGIYVSCHIALSFSWVYLLAAAVLLLSFIFVSIEHNVRFAALLSCLALLTGVLSSQNSRLLPASHIARALSNENNRMYTLQGSIDNEPTRNNNRICFVLKTEALCAQNRCYRCCGEILVHCKFKGTLRFQDTLRVTGSIYRFFNNDRYPPKGYRGYLYNNNIYAVMKVKSANGVVKLQRKKGGSWLKRLTLRLKQIMQDCIFKNITPATAGVLNAMILGEKRYVPALINNAMIKSGTVHILVVSGFNVGLIASLGMLLLKLLRIRRALRPYLTVLVLLVYCLMTGASTPVLRATIMATVFMFSCAVKREPDIYTSLALAAVCITAMNPRQLFDAGFQLSFASVISIVFLYPKLKRLVCLDRVKIPCLRYVIEGCLVSLSAWMGTAGLIAHYFKIFSPVTIVANLCIVPLATLITLCGFSMFFIKLLLPVFTPCFARSCEVLVMLLLRINDFLIALPGAYLRWD